MVLYRLLNQVNRMHAALVVILVLVSIPISLFSLLNELAALVLVHGSDYLAVFNLPSPPSAVQPIESLSTGAS
jgi:hypothetical protein